MNSFSLSPYLPRTLAALMGAALLCDAAYLVTMKVTNLGTVVPAILGAGLLWWAWKAPVLQGVIWRWIFIGLALWLLSVLAFFGFLHHTANATNFIATNAVTAGSTPIFMPRLILVLGSSTPQAQASPTLRERLKLAHTLALQYPAAPVVVSGGVDHAETVSEARVMADYLHDLGLPPERVVLEDASTTTYENLIFSANLVSQRYGITKDAPLLIVTSEFHTHRAQWIAAKAGWKQVRTAGAPTPLYVRYNAWLREYFSWIKGRALNEF